MPTFNNRQEYEAWKAGLQETTVPPPLAGGDRSRSHRPVDDGRAHEAGKRMILAGIGATCWPWILLGANLGFNAYLGIVGPMTIAFGCRVLIYEPEMPIYYVSLGDTLWCLAGIGVGAFSFYMAGFLAPESPKRMNALVAIVLLAGGMIVAFIYSVIAKRLQRRG